VIINKYGKIDLALALAKGRYPQGFAWSLTIAEQLNGKKSATPMQSTPVRAKR